jgi:hypothetical protein
MACILKLETVVFVETLKLTTNHTNQILEPFLWAYVSQHL